MRIQSCHSDEERGLDAYFSPPEAVHSLIALERNFIPRIIWEPACGDGAIVKPFRQSGFRVLASDISDYGLEDSKPFTDFLKSDKPTVSDDDGLAIITNPPYKLALDFAKKAIKDADYVAFLLRTNWLESTSRLPFFKEHPPSRILVSSRRLPMMHRRGWEGPKAPSNTCFSWFIWDAFSEDDSKVQWFDWKDHIPSQEHARTSMNTGMSPATQ